MLSAVACHESLTAFFSKEYELHIVDRVGGGDSFGGGLIYALMGGRRNIRAEQNLRLSVAAVSDIVLSLSGSAFHWFAWIAHTERGLEINEFAIHSDASDIAPRHDFRMNSLRLEAIDYLEAHAAVVVRTVPKTSLRLLLLHLAACRDVVMPFAILAIYEVIPHKLPYLSRLIEIFLLARNLPSIDTANDGFTLRPPRKSALQAL